jgi:hypothetical protein
MVEQRWLKIKKFGNYNCNLSKTKLIIGQKNKRIIEPVTKQRTR